MKKSIFLSLMAILVISFCSSGAPHNPQVFTKEKVVNSQTIQAAIMNVSDLTLLTDQPQQCPEVQVLTTMIADANANVNFATMKTSKKFTAILITGNKDGTCRTQFVCPEVQHTTDITVATTDNTRNYTGNAQTTGCSEVQFKPDNIAVKDANTNFEKTGGSKQTKT